MSASSRKLLVLDLDETLVHARDLPLQRPADLRVASYHVYRRPHLSRFIEFALDTFQVGVWTSSGSLYAEPLVAALFPPGALRFVWSASRCTMKRNMDTDEYVGTKTLKKVKSLGYSLESVIAIDDTPAKYASSYGNLVTIREYLGASDDDELLLLMHYLGRLAHTSNVRTIEKRNWRAGTIQRLSAG